MGRAISLIIVLLLTQWSTATVSADDSLEFKLPAADGAVAELIASTEPAKFAIVYFFSTECPLSRLYTQRLIELHNQYSARNVRFYAVNSTTQDSIDDIKTFAAELSVPFPVIKDYDNVVADAYQATRTAEVFLLNGDLQIKYSGRIDDQYSPGVSRASAKVHFLKDAIAALLDGQAPPTKQTDPVGCLIGRVKKTVDQPTVTYTQQISRVIQTHCLECHRDGEIGPFSMEDYEEVKGWAEMMVEVTENNRMPPWHATAAHSKFKNERFLSATDKKLFRDWLEQGTPYGDAADLPPAMEFTNGWRLPKQPDAVITMQKEPFVVPPTGTVEYQYFVVDPGFTEDRWIAAADVIPGNRSVLHHSIVFIRPPDGSRFRGIGMLAAYVPGQGTPTHHPSRATFVPAGSKFVFQQHYTPVGTEQSDVTRLGIVFADPAEITHEVYTLMAINQDFEIPPKQQLQVKASVRRLPKDGVMISVAPHMHYRGKAFQLFANVNGARQQLIDVPAYDFNWQHVYQFAEPIALADLAELNCDFEFDNSTDNPFNPDADRTVTWGDQTWEEMAVAFVKVAKPIKQEASTTPKIPKNPTEAPQPVVDEEKLNAFLDDYFATFDADKNGEIIRDELPLTLKRYGFRRFDTDKDGILTRAELRQRAVGRFTK